VLIEHTSGLVIALAASPSLHTAAIAPTLDGDIPGKGKDSTVLVAVGHRTMIHAIARPSAVPSGATSLSCRMVEVSVEIMQFMQFLSQPRHNTGKHRYKEYASRLAAAGYSEVRQLARAEAEDLTRRPRPGVALADTRVIIWEAKQQLAGASWFPELHCTNQHR